MLPIDGDGDLILSFSRCPYPIASHDINSTFNYANKAALALFKTSWGEMIGLDSRVSAPETAQEDRMKLLTNVSQLGFVEDYRGIRVAFDGSFFKIHKATIWNIIDSNNNNQGQAVIIMDHSQS